MPAGDYLKLTRFPLVFTAVADSAAGYLLALPAGAELRPTALGLAAGVSACFYASGMVYNDVADQLRDRVLHPERPIPSKRVTSDRAQRFGKALLFVALSGSCVFGLLAGGWALGMAILILGYNFLFKHVRWGGALAMGLIRGMNLGLGAFAAAHLAPGSPALPGFGAFPWAGMGVLALYVTLLTLLSTWEDSKDSPTRRVGLAAAGMAAAPLAIAVPAGAGPRWAAVLPTLWILPWAVRAVALPSRERLMQVVRWGVLGIILLDAAQVAVTGRTRESLWIAGLLLPALLLLPVFRRL